MKKFDNGVKEVPCTVVEKNEDGTLGLFAPEGDNDNVVYFSGIDPSRVTDSE